MIIVDGIYLKPGLYSANYTMINRLFKLLQASTHRKTRKTQSMMKGGTSCSHKPAFRILRCPYSQLPNVSSMCDVIETKKQQHLDRLKWKWLPRLMPPDQKMQQEQMSRACSCGRFVRRSGEREGHSKKVGADGTRLALPSSSKSR